jgi:NAD(P)-dependent dehydrogenase (short-subunit alcohol dehydrogenase family)
MRDEPGDAARVALVTGASRGIGRAIAVALAGRGWRVVVNYRANADAAARTMQLVKSAGGVGASVPADVTSDADRRRLLDETLSMFGRLDLLVNNAGIGPRERRDILDTAESSYDEVMAANLKGPFFLTQLVANAMIELMKSGLMESATIINIGSVSAYAASTNRPEYCLSKAGVAMMTALYAARLAEHGIRVYEVRPGIVKTDMTAPVERNYDRLIAEGLTPIARWGEPEDVARAVAAIAEGSFSFSTGEVINVDGGFHLRRL